jgi:hypothetical protein
MGGRKADGDGNVHSKHESVSSECEVEDGNYKHNEAEMDDMNSDRVTLAELNNGERLQEGN